ncbi:LysR family transcriptional regulator [Clostridium sp. AM58-1XD]|uniref:LysR family transcriptional regulator n=1 Tax=Clostridium sp. AM58-1XD TaxID=2292307 RepID=UPI000E5327BD|nr:LysR family transcriptional regulator [Clostridium sp. AM58-1XD]RGY98436.1 LysR family transcriptional regulator [Clostridium sp. AM58-1XD]
MDTKYLTYIITIAEEKNMTKAAEKLFVSQSSLSYYLSKLEHEIGTPLFLRVKNEFLLTPAGQMYIESAREVVAIKERLYQNISNLDNRAHIIISTTSVWGNRMLADIIPQIQEVFPDVTFELSQKEISILAKEISDGAIDFALLSVASKSELDDMTEVLREEELLFAVPTNHPYVRSHPGNTIFRRELVSSFRGETFYLSKKGTANRYVADRLFMEYTNSIVSHICEITGLPLTCDMVAQGTGVAFIPISGRSREKQIHYYSVQPKLYRYNILVHRKNLVLNKPEQAFCDLVKNYFKK